MCTVTILPIGKDDFVLTSNRDEAPERETLVPQVYAILDTEMMFPKDKVAGGTWIGVSKKNRMICLLNGGFEIHERRPEYAQSRGLVVIDLLAATHLLEAIDEYDLKNVEPFTLVMADWNNGLNFFELVWDGIQKYVQEIPRSPRIWSSSTLYTASMKNERQQWFNEFISRTSIGPKDILKFHQTSHIDNSEYGVVMSRSYVKTTSITQIIKTKDQLTMTFDNLQNNLRAYSDLKLPRSIHG